ncbi:MAG: gluconokinase [Rubrivivax sp.]|jgi:gluconokinase
MASPRIVVMGVSGCGKSTVGRLLADALAVPFLEGDELHPPANVERMAAGVALSDADRQGWLEAIAESLARSRAAGAGLVVTCSALKRRYRDLLRAADPGLMLVFLQGPPELLAGRLSGRRGHYMPPSLLPSQLQTLEPPAPDEGALVQDIHREPGAIVASVRRHLQDAPA